MVPGPFSFISPGKKESENMVHRRKQETLPDRMALVQTDDGKWFPAFATLSVRSYRVWEMYVLEESPAFIPPALPPWQIHHMDTTAVKKR